MNGPDLLLTRAPEAAKVFSLLTEVFDPIAAESFRRLLLHHPRRGLIRQAAFTDATGNLVAYAIFLPQRLVIDGVTLEVGQLEAVATAKAYRGHGLFPRLHDDLLRQTASRRYPFIMVFGIPTYYRKLGYFFTTPFYARAHMDAATATMLPRVKGLRHRRGRAGDAATLLRLYHLHLAGAQVFIPRDLKKMAVWLDKYEAAGDVETHVFTRGEKIVAYLRIHFQSTGMMVMEAAGWTSTTLPAALRMLGRRALGKDLPDISLLLPGDDPLSAAARFHGAEPVDPMWTYALQVSVIDAKGLLEKLKPAFDRRLAKSVFRDATLSLPCHSFGRPFTLEIKKGRFVGVGDGHDLPSVLSVRGGREAWVRLAFGVASFNDLLLREPDLRCPANLQPVMETLFPPLRPYLNELDSF